ncbi:unnamed protein product [Rodentolepis nana]|uniref:Uncharacterized protein n=1 Tax=Rodentolepis nana TaxID=102285 RepID=A0A0R3TSA8_RODNA|nr:unnamed protein product [Rodentolepis nana]
MIIANLLTNAGARSQFWLQTELIQLLAENITVNSDMSLLCGAILVAVNILDAPELLATTVGGDSPGELFTQILSLLLFDNFRSHRSSYKQPSSSSWCRHSAHSSSSRRYHRAITNVTTNTVSSTPPRQSPEPMETIDSLTVAEVAPQEKALLRLISAFLDLFHTYSDSSSIATHIGGSSMTRQMFKEVWDWQYQCGRGNGADSDDEQQQQLFSSGSRRRCKRFAIATASTPSTSHYRSIGSPVLLVRRQEEAKTVMERCLADPGGGLKAFLTGLMKKLNEDNDEEEGDDNYEGEQSSRSQSGGVDKDREEEESENPSCDVSGVSGEQEGGNEDDYEDN